MRISRGVIIGVAVVLIAGCSSGASESITPPPVSVVTVTAQAPASNRTEQISPSVDVSSTTRPSANALDSPDSFTADSPVPAGIQQDGSPLTNITQQLGVSDAVYVALFSDPSDQIHVAGVSTQTGKVLWSTDAVGPKIDETTGQRTRCVKLDSEFITCAKYLINVTDGELIKTNGSVYASIPQGFIASAQNDGVSTTSLVNKNDGAIIWSFPAGATFQTVLEDGEVLATVLEGPKTTKVVVLDPDTGVVVKQVDGQAFPTGGAWVRVTYADSVEQTLGTTEQVDSSSGAAPWKTDGVAISGNWRWANINSPWEFEAQAPAPIILSIEVANQSSTADIYRAIDPQTGAELWACDPDKCGGSRIFGLTADRLVTGNKLLNRSSGDTITDFGGGTNSGPKLLMPNYLVVRDDEANQTEVMSLVNGKVLWFQRQEGSIIEAGSCFVIIDQLTQTQVCPQ